jgi:hypothetical protein
MPLLVEVARAGWRPVAPVRADDRLWIGRFGTGLGLIITVSNPTRETLPARLEVDTRTLGLAGGVFAFHEKSPPGGVPLRNEIAAGDTRLSFDLQPKEFRVLRAVAAFGPLATGAVVLAQEGRDDYGRLVTTCTIEQAHLPLTDARLWLPKESSLEVTVRSQARNEVECRSGKGEVRVQCRLKPQAQIVARAEGPVRLTSTVEELCTFPFLIDNKPAAAIVLPANATPEEKTAATRLSVYFEYYLGRQADLLAGPGSLKNPALELPMVSDAALAPAGASLIAVGTPTDHPLVAAWVRSQVRNEVEYRPRRHAATASWLTTNQALGKDGVRGVISLGQTGRREERHGVRSLLVVAAEPAAVDEAMLQLLSVLDGKYPSTWGLFRSDATEKAGLAGKDFTGGEKPEVTTPSSPEETGPITLPADNLLQNAGFEEGNPSPTGWAFSSPNASEHQCEFSTDAREGQRAVYVPRGQYWQQTVELKPLAWYRYRVWRQLGANSTFLLWWCGLLEDGSERGGERLYEQCQPNLDLIPNFLPADYFSQPDVWNLTEMTFRAPGYPRYSIRLGGWGKVLVDAAVLEPAAGP